MTDKNNMTGIALITQERNRQQTQEGWSAEHDDQHDSGELAWMACYYAIPYIILRKCGCGAQMAFTPNALFAETGWADIWAKRCGHHDRLKDLTKAGALIAAEIDRLLRLADNEAGNRE